MARAATNSDVFNAIAEPQRREILTLLKSGEQTVGRMVEGLNIAQPSVSKHLRVLRDVGLVGVRSDGPRRLYSLRAVGLEPVHRWVGGFEQFWSEAFGRLSAYVSELQEEHDDDD